jgi:hypothetical protein
VQSKEQLRSDSELPPNDIPGRMLTCRVDELRPHPSYERHGFTVPASQLSALAGRGDLAFNEPLVVTRQRTIIDGYALWKLAGQRGRTTLSCIEYDLTDTEALRWLLEKHCRSDRLNAFCRIILALELEPWFKEQARSNQQVGGRSKGSSNLSEAEKVDVRSKIALAASASAGNVTKVKTLTATAGLDRGLLEALRNGEVSIHRAWKWSREQPARQREALWDYRSNKGVRQAIRLLVLTHRAKGSVDALALTDLVTCLSALNGNQICSVNLIVIKTTEIALAVTEGLLEALRIQGALPTK